MPTIPTIDDAQRVVEQVGSYVYVSVSTAASEIPHTGEHLKRLWADVTRYGPNIPGIQLPSLGDFEVPPPPPPPPPPRTMWQGSADWVEDHPWTVLGVGVGIVVGATLLVGYGGALGANRRRGRQQKGTRERRQVVVVLGGDAPTALPVVLQLERKGFIVIASCATADAASELEHKCNGYVRALVLDPTLPDSVPNFVRLLLSALSRRFPINAPGDPHISPTSHPYVHSIVSLLGLYSPTTPQPVPLEHLRLQDDYLPYLIATHVTPLTALQALLPLLRSTPARARDNAENGRGQMSIIICLPAADAQIGLPFSAARAMSAAATARAADVLRREMRAAASTGSASAMKYINVVTMDVGAVETPRPRARMIGSSQADFEGWSESEKSAYGPAYLAAAGQEANGSVRRHPTSAHAFAESIVDVVLHGHKRTVSIFGRSLSLGPIAKWILGWRHPVGAGAMTYTLASSLPHTLLDALLSLPYLMIGARNAMLPVPPPPIVTPNDLPTERRSTASSVLTPITSLSAATSVAPVSDPESEAGSDADVESNASSGEHADIKSSWVSLGSSTTTNPWKGPF